MYTLGFYIAVGPLFSPFIQVDQVSKTSMKPLRPAATG